MTNDKYSTKISDLSEEDRKSVKKQLYLLRYMMHQCEQYMWDYVMDDQTALKFLGAMGMAHNGIEEAVKVLVKVHDLPHIGTPALRPWCLTALYLSSFPWA
jgi:hypothetical protein